MYNDKPRGHFPEKIDLMSLCFVGCLFIPIWWLEQEVMNNYCCGSFAYISDFNVATVPFAIFHFISSYNMSYFIITKLLIATGTSSHASFTKYVGGIEKAPAGLY